MYEVRQEQYTTVIREMMAIPATGSAAAISEQEARFIVVDAYMHFYPLITMDLTRKQLTNIEPRKEYGKGSMNMFVSVPAYPPADYKKGGNDGTRRDLNTRSLEDAACCRCCSS